MLVLLLAVSISFRTSAIVINPGYSISVGNETYTVNQTMNFGSIIISDSYVIFNNTGFYISSGNAIAITLVYINSDIAGAGDGEKILEFYADTTVGSVVFDLSGFPAGNDYELKRSGSSIATPTADGSGFISFTNSVWSSHLFEIFQVGEGVVNSPPVVSNIPGQTILEGASFTQINLDNYVTDVEDPDADIDWSYSGNTDLLVSIINRVATISTPNSNWHGVETITFTAEDTGGLTDSDDATFTVTANIPSDPPSQPPPVPPPSLPTEPEEQDNITEQNNPPETPIKSSGPTSVEIGVEYTYSSSTFDVDDDQIRFMFDWGDGNLSDWSEFVQSNISVLMSYSWSSISNYEIIVMAQDENGLNSSWSPALNVTVSQAELGIPPVVNINISGDLYVNGSIVFDASGSFDPDGMIVSYLWDFGDGENDSGISPSHIYKNPGEYTVTLVVTDNTGNTYSKSILVTVASESEELESAEESMAIPFYLGVAFIGIATVLLFSVAIIFRDQVKLFISTYFIYPFSAVRVSHTKHKMEKIDAKIKEINKELKRIGAKTAFKGSSVRGRARLYDEIQEGYIRTDSKTKLDIEEKKIFDEFDDVRTGETTDRVIKMGLKPYKSLGEDRDDQSLKDFDVGIMVDKIVSLYGAEKSIIFDIEKEGLPYESYIDNIERKVDDLFILKIRNSIDNMV